MKDVEAIYCVHVCVCAVECANANAPYAIVLFDIYSRSVCPIAPCLSIRCHYLSLPS